MTFWLMPQPSQMCLLLQQCLDGTDPLTPLLPASAPSALLSRHHLRHHLRDQTRFIFSTLTPHHRTTHLHSYCRTAMSSQIRQNCSTGWRLPTARPARTCARTYLCPDEGAPEGGGRFFLELVAEKHEGAQRLEAVKPARWRLLFQDELPPPERSGHDSGRHAGRPAPERSLSPAFWACRPRVLPADPPL